MTKTRALGLVLGLGSWTVLLACGDSGGGTGTDTESGTQGSGSASGMIATVSTTGVSATAGSTAADTDIIEPVCFELQDQAVALVQDNQGCAEGESCVLVDMSALNPTCLFAFQCPTAFNSVADVDAFMTMAQELSQLYDENCTFCPVPMCADPAGLEAICELTIGTCVLGK